MDLQKKKKNSHFLKNSQPRGGEGGGSGESGMVSHFLPVLNYDSFPKLNLNYFLMVVIQLYNAGFVLIKQQVHKKTNEVFNSAKVSQALLS